MSLGLCARLNVVIHCAEDTGRLSASEWTLQDRGGNTQYVRYLFFSKSQQPLNCSSTISIPKYGTFSANLLLGRPYYITYDLLDRQDGNKKTTVLRAVPAAELHAEHLSNDVATPAESRDEKTAATPAAEDSIEVIDNDGQVLIRNNRLTVDDPSRQALSMEEIEELKKAGTGSGKEIIAKIMAAHSALSEKTQYSLAKYTLRKSRKYMRRFTVLPMGVDVLSKIWLEKESTRIMELREETLGLMMSWGNVHYHDTVKKDAEGEGQSLVKQGRYLVIDDTCGLLTAAVADKMGILYPVEEDKHAFNGADKDTTADEDIIMAEALTSDAPTVNDSALPPKEDITTTVKDQDIESTSDAKPTPGPWPHKRPNQSSASSNTITVLHANTQPNISMLEPFGYNPDRPDDAHPLYTHIRTLTWLQLLDPASDTIYQEPLPPEVTSTDDVKLPLAQRLANMKPGKRSSYYKKRKRWERVKTIVDETRAGGFDSLIVATTMDPVGVLKHCVPLVGGGGNVVIYSPSVEPLTRVMDLYSRDRRAGYVKLLQSAEEEGHEPVVDEEDFPVDPTLLLNPMLQTARAREWQVLPMRTHPMMTGRGGSEGYLFTATRVLPIKGIKIEAKGKFGKKRKVETGNEKESKHKKANTKSSKEEEEKTGQNSTSIGTAEPASRVKEAEDEEMKTVHTELSSET
jgi:tRNA (adenine-N(1)-)-methyltransferase non-catalytic subunit